MPQPIESPYYTHSQHPVSNAVGTVVSATTYHQQFTPFHTTSSYRSKQVVSAASSAKQYMTTATMMTNDGWEVLSPCAVPMTSVSSMTPVVSSSLSASEESAGGSAMACVSPFRSTSAYMSGVQGNGLLAMATPMQTAGFGAIAQTAAVAYAAGCHDSACAQHRLGEHYQFLHHGGGTHGGETIVGRSANHYLWSPRRRTFYRGVNPCRRCCLAPRGMRDSIRRI